jgi:hypothetical protein
LSVSHICEIFMSSFARRFNISHRSGFESARAIVWTFVYEGNCMFGVIG